MRQTKEFPVPEEHVGSWMCSKVSVLAFTENGYIHQTILGWSVVITWIFDKYVPVRSRRIWRILESTCSRQFLSVVKVLFHSSNLPRWVQAEDQAAWILIPDVTLWDHCTLSCHCVVKGKYCFLHLPFKGLRLTDEKARNFSYWGLFQYHVSQKPLASSHCTFWWVILFLISSVQQSSWA